MALFSKKPKLEELLLNENFKVDREVVLGNVSGFVEQKLLVDVDTKRFAHYVYIFNRTLKVYNFKDVLSFELQEDGHTLSEGTAAKALAGGLLFGGIGLIAGAAGKQKSRPVCESMILRVRLNDIQEPTIAFTLVASKIKRKDPRYQKAKERAEEILGILAFIENNKGSDQETRIPEPGNSTASQLREYKQLLDEGILTQEEFDGKKQQLLQH